MLRYRGVVSGQALELGAAALSFLIGTWEGHLTPPEAISLADRASKSRDAAMVRSGAALALSVLPHSAALNPNQIQRAIQQCKEQRHEMLEKACDAVENAAAGPLPLSYSVTKCCYLIDAFFMFQVVECIQMSCLRWHVIGMTFTRSIYHLRRIR